MMLPGPPVPSLFLFRDTEALAACKNSSRCPSQKGFKYNKPGGFPPSPFPAAAFKAIPSISCPSFAEAHRCSLCPWKSFLSLEGGKKQREKKDFFPSCCKRGGWLGDLLGCYGLGPTGPCPAACGLPQRRSSMLVGALVEINASLVRSGLLARPFVFVRKVVTDGEWHKAHEWL